MAAEGSAKNPTSRELLASTRKKQILCVAKRLFAADGYHATSMRAINRKVGMSEALTYHYFPGGKMEIFSAVLREMEEDRAEDIDQTVKAFPVELSIKAALRILVNKVAERFDKDSEFLQIMLRERQLAGHGRMNVLSFSGQQFIVSMCSFLAMKADQGEIRWMDFNMALSQFMCHVEMAALQQILCGNEFNANAFTQQVQAIVDFTVDIWSI